MMAGDDDDDAKTRSEGICYVGRAAAVFTCSDGLRWRLGKDVCREKRPSKPLLSVCGSTNARISSAYYRQTILPGIASVRLARCEVAVVPKANRVGPAGRGLISVG